MTGEVKFDSVGGYLWFDRDEWGIIVDALIEHRQNTLAFSHDTDAERAERVEMTASILASINAVMGLPPQDEQASDPDPFERKRWVVVLDAIGPKPQRLLIDVDDGFVMAHLARDDFGDQIAEGLNEAERQGDG